MAEQQNDWQAQDRHELHDPSNPPNAMLRDETRNRALMSYVLPIVIFFVIVGLGLVYWSTRPAGGPVPDESTIGTTGERTPGGSDPTPAFGSSRDELEFRGADQPDDDRPDVAPGR